MSSPLAGISIGASYLAADVEAQIREKVRGMGGEFHHELRSSTDFSICGKRWTEKYNYAIQYEIMSISPETFFAAHMQWVQGDELDSRAFFIEHKMQTFENMLLTITNMDNEQRNGFQTFLEANGANYVPSLNQRVTVLVSPLDQGKKVNGARKWQIPVAAPKWMTDSSKIGAALDPHNYDPGNPRATMEPPMIFPKRRVSVAGNSSRGDDSLATGDTSTEADTSTSSVSSTSRLISKRKSAPTGGGLLAKRLPTSIGATFIKPPAALTNKSDRRTDRLFAAINFTFVGFNEREHGILGRTVNSLGGQIEHDRPHYIIVNSVKPEKPDQINGAKIITEWALERSSFHKEMMLDSKWSQPVYAQPCKGFVNLRICISGFSEIDQRHVTSLIKSLGGEFRETLTADRDSLVARSSQAHKVRYAKNWGVPVVSSDWSWQCALEEKISPIADQHCLDGSGFRAAPRRDNLSDTSSASIGSSMESSAASESLTGPTPLSVSSSETTLTAQPSKSFHLQIGRMVAAGRYPSKSHHSSRASPETTELNEHAEVRYQDDDADKQAEISLAMGERPPTPPPAEPKVPSMRSSIYSRRRSRT